MEQFSMAIATDYSGMSVGRMTELRRSLREKGIQFRVVKNSLAHLAADAAGRPLLKDIIQGPTGIAIGSGEAVETARALSEFIRATRAPVRVRGGVLGERVLSAGEVGTLATLPSRDELLARLMGQLQAPVAGLLYVLNAPLSGLARVLQRYGETKGERLEQ